MKSTRPRTPRRPALSAPALLIGGVLWAAVFVSLVIVLRRGANAENQPEAGQPGNPSSEKKVKGMWDKSGVKDFSFVERNGKTVTRKDLLGKPWAVCFFFTRCQGTCPRISAAMREVHLAVKDLPVKMVSISVDPKYDTQKVLKQYARIYTKDEKNWLFLTGDQDKTYRLIRDSFKLPVKEVTGPERRPGWEVLHSNRILLVGADGVVRNSYKALEEDERKRLIADFKAEAKTIKKP